MNIADRVQQLRKMKGMTQEELADKVGVSRQAVSKWESEQSTPDIDKIIALSEYFEVTTDYLLKGVEPVKGNDDKAQKIGGQILYIASTAFIVIGLLCAWGGWHEEQTLESIFGSMIIQVVGVVGYYIAKIISDEKAPRTVVALNCILVSFIPISMLAGAIANLVIRFKSMIAPYPVDVVSGVIFIVLYSLAMGVIGWFLKKKN